MAAVLAQHRAGSGQSFFSGKICQIWQNWGTKDEVLAKARRQINVLSRGVACPGPC